MLYEPPINSQEDGIYQWVDKRGSNPNEKIFIIGHKAFSLPGYNIFSRRYIIEMIRCKEIEKINKK